MKPSDAGRCCSVFFSSTAPLTKLAPRVAELPLAPPSVHGDANGHVHVPPRPTQPRLLAPHLKVSIRFKQDEE